MRYKIELRHGQAYSTIYINAIYKSTDNQEHVFKFNTGLKIQKKHWKNSKVVRDPSAEQMNNILDSYLQKFKEAQLDAQAKQIELSNDYLRDFLSRETKPKVEKTLLIPFVEQFIEKSKSRINTKTGRKLDNSTITAYNSTRDRLLDYEKKHGIKLKFTDIDTEFYNNFNEMLKTGTFPYALNTIGKFIRRVKEFLNAANDEGVTTWQGHKKKSFKVLQEDIPNIYLTEAELKTLYECKDLKPYQDKARDIFIIGCFTGLRVSDYGRLDAANIDDGILRVRTQKTDEIVFIPLHPYVKEILAKYDGQFPSISSQRLNDYIKEVAQLAEIDTPVVIQRTEGGVLQTHRMPKHEAISSHTARRSFATNLYLQEFPHIQIMKITGHRTEKAFLSYIKITKQEAANQLLEHWKNLQKI